MTHLAQTARMQDSPNFRDYGRTRQHICNQRQLRSLLQLVSVCFVSLRSLPLYPVEKLVTMEKPGTGTSSVCVCRDVVDKIEKK